MTGPVDNHAREPVWDGITRAWHGLLAVTVIVGWILGEFRTFSIMQWHFYAGYCIAGLLGFRIFWGFQGPGPVRLTALVPGPEAFIDYLKTLPDRKPSGIRGHSPLGALASLVFLALLIFQVSTGLFSEDDDLFHEGPLADWISSDGNRRASWLHRLGAKAVLAMFLLHISAMLFYAVWKKENLVIAMISGTKLVRHKQDTG